MNKKFGILAIVLTVLMCFLSISVFAAGDDMENSQMPFVDSEQISPNHPEIQTEEDFMEDFENLFGNGGEEFFIATVAGILFSFLFFPGIVLVVVFAVLNSKTKKKIKDYERFFGPLSGKQSAYYNQNMYNAPYGSQPVNSTGAPMGTIPTGNIYIPQNDVNNQQGGQI